ncbi:MIT C-terminal domain-containing protein [Tabrizicola soli]|uniref:MIT C-terminal domain-containing protein n=1 Tax=Tabrizicola soli TaxID=2185115 RepID=UPI00362FCE78
MSFDALLGPWLDGAAEITLTDPYIRVYHQMRNLMELLEVVALRKPDGEDVQFRHHHSRPGRPRAPDRLSRADPGRDFPTWRGVHLGL